MACKVDELAESLHVGNISYVRGVLKKSCSKAQILDFVEAYSEHGEDLLSSLKRTKRLLED